jgi:hypothetical protein
VDVRLDEVVLKALERDRDRRYQRASEVGSAISHISEHAAAPVAAAAPAAPEAGTKARAEEHGAYQRFPLSAGSRIEVRAEDADVVLKGVRGPAEVSGDAAFTAARTGTLLAVSAASGGGRVVVGVPEGIPVDAFTRAGAVRASDLDGRAELGTGAGAITVEGLRGGLRVRSGAGNLTLRRIEADDLQVDAGTADVLVDGLSLERGSAGIRVGSGNVRLNVVPQRSSFRYAMASASGDVSSSFGPSAGNRADGVVGSGLGMLRAETGAGRVDLGAAGEEAFRHREAEEADRSRRSRRWAAFFNHLGVYAVANAALLLLNLVVSPNDLWMLWVAVPWGGALALHGYKLGVRSLMGRAAGSKKVIGDWAAAPTRERRRTWSSVGKHLGVFLGVNGFLAFVNFYSGGWGAYPWFLWVAAPWGLLLSCQVWFTLVESVPRVLAPGEPEVPGPEEIAARQERVSSRWAGFFQSFGTFAIVNGLVAGILHLAGALSVAPWVMAAWGLPLFLQFFGAAQETAEFAVLERRARRGGDPGARAGGRFPLLYPLLMAAALLLAGTFAFGYLPAASAHHPPDTALAAASGAVQAHPVIFWGAMGGLLALSLGFYFGTGAPRWARALFVAVAAALVLAVAAAALGVSAPVL